MNPDGIDTSVAEATATPASAPAPPRSNLDLAAADREFRERELRNVNDHLPALIGQFDAAIRFRYLNAYYRHLMGDAARDAVGKTMAEILGEDIYRKRRPYLDRALAGEIVRFEAEFPSTSGPRLLSHVYTPEIDDQGKVCGIYVFAIDYRLTTKIETHLLTHLNAQEAAVWRLLNTKAGSRIRDAEDKFIYSTVEKYWPQFTAECPLPGFRAISARRAIRILQTQPKRTPGIGLRAWGTGASAEVNVHVSIHSETKPWDELHQRILSSGLTDIVEAINRKRTEVVFDPEL